MSENTKAKRASAAAIVVDDAVGVTESHWFVALVNYNSEKQVSEKLTKRGIVNYVPTQSEIRVWRNGRKTKVDRVVIPSVIFVNCTEELRREIVNLPYIFRFMTNKAWKTHDSFHAPLAIISDNEIDRLKFMLGQSDVPIEIAESPIKRGNKVRVIRGSLKGLVGQVIDTNDTKSELIVALEFFGCARLYIDTKNLDIVK